jgi:hypothetical protein
VSCTLDRVDWNAELVRGDLGKAVQQEPTCTSCLSDDLSARCSCCQSLQPRKRHRGCSLSLRSREWVSLLRACAFESQKKVFELKKVLPAGIDFAAYAE